MTASGPTRCLVCHRKYVAGLVGSKKKVELVTLIFVSHLKYDYLMHAVLGLAASDLTQDDPSLVEAAMSHRLKAIKAVKKALADAPRRPRQQQQQQTGSSACGSGSGSGAFSSDEGNALLATCFALTFQSVLLEDGMAEYMTFIRGIIIVAIQMYTRGARFLFSNFIEDEQDALLRPLIEQVPMINRVWAEGAAAAVAGLSPLVMMAKERDEEDGKTAAAYQAYLATMAEQMLASPFGAYKAVARHYSWWMQLPHDRFRAVVDPGSQLFTLLATHWIAIKMVMKPVTEVELRVSETNKKRLQQRRRDGLEDGMARWLRHANAQVAPEFQAYNRWPVWVQRQIARDPGFFGATS